MFKSRRISLNLKVTFIISLLLCIIFLGLNVFNTIAMRKMSTDLSISILEEISNNEARNTSSFVASSFYNINVMAASVQELLDDGIRGRAYYEEFLENIIKELPEYIGAASITFEPDVFGLDSDYIDTKYRDSLGRFSAYFERTAENDINIRPFNKDELFGDYYTEPMKTKTKYLTDIYSFDVGGESVSMYTWSIPLFINNRAVGVITIDIFADFFKESLLKSKIQDFKNSEYALFTDTGNIITTSDDMSALGNNVVDISPRFKENSILERVSKGEAFLYKSKSGPSTIHFVRALPVNDGKYWGLEVIIPMSVILAEVNKVSMIMIVLTILSIFVVYIVVSLVIRKFITSKLTLLVGDMKRISGGDISWTVPDAVLSEKDELGDIANAVSKILDEFNGAMLNVKNASGEIEAAANEVAQGNADLSMRTESQAAVLEETSSSMEEMASTIKSSADHSLLGDKMMIESKESISEAGEVISSTTNSIEDVLEASAKITDITKIIEGIALQTNILALNAAVEAARAGEQGRGFAVVASEVRSLAQTTQTSVKNITELVANVDEKIRLATSSARKSKEIFTDIQGKIDSTAKIMQEISSTAVEQQTGVNEINRAVTEMDIATQKNATLVQESTTAASALLSQAKELVDVVSFFKTRDGSSVVKTPVKATKENTLVRPVIKENVEIKETTSPEETSDYYKILSPISSKPSSSGKENEFGSSLIKSNDKTDEEFETF